MHTHLLPVAGFCLLFLLPLESRVITQHTSLAVVIDMKNKVHSIIKKSTPKAYTAFRIFMKLAEILPSFLKKIKNT